MLIPDVERRSRGWRASLVTRTARSTVSTVVHIVVERTVARTSSNHRLGAHSDCWRRASRRPRTRVTRSTSPSGSPRPETVDGEEPTASVARTAASSCNPWSSAAVWLRLSRSQHQHLGALVARCPSCDSRHELEANDLGRSPLLLAPVVLVASARPLQPRASVSAVRIRSRSFFSIAPSGFFVEVASEESSVFVTHHLGHRLC